MKIERMLQSQGFGSRRECRALVRAGLFSIDGEVIEDPFIDIDPVAHPFVVDGEVWQYREKAYLMLNKPSGHECSHKPHHHHSVYALLPPQLSVRGVQTVGRLDHDTTGLVLLSDDGQFIHFWSSGKKRIPKTYEVTTSDPVSDETLRQLREGVLLHDESSPIRAFSCASEGEYHLRLTVTEGKYHQVKRMVAATGNRVEALHRTHVGGLSLPSDLPLGEWRWLDAQDWERLPDFDTRG